MSDMKTKHAPYSLYKKRVGTRQYWYVRFWDERTRKYSVHRSTGIEAGGKKERRGDAERAAAELLPAVVFNVSHMTMLQYLQAFWRAESPHFRENELIQGRKLSAYYIKASQDIIRLHIGKYPPFEGLRIERLTPGLIRDFMLWEAERGVSPSRINRALQVIRVPVRYAVGRDEAKADPFAKVKPAFQKRREKGVLTRREVAALVSAGVKNLERRLAVLLGLLCGMRLGEVRGLCWEDIDAEQGVIHIRHNWQDLEGVKPPKYDSNRDTPVIGLLAEALNAWHRERGFPRRGLVFARKKDGKPPCNGFFRLAMNSELAAAGIPGVWTSRKPKPEGYVNEQSARNLSFHSLRHTFVTLSRLAGISDFQTQALAGHRSTQMMDRYSHPAQVVDMGRCKGALEGLVGGI
jgi:integrase